jgi:oligopeptide transport system substrate-binding protein
MKEIYFPLFTSLLALMGFLSGCKSSQLPIDQKDVLYIANEAQPQSLDPQIGTGVPEMRVILGLFEGLLRLNGETLQPEPSLAESWSVDPTGCIYTFQLRSNAKWSNGDPITAEGFVHSFAHLFSPNSRSPHPESLYCIKNTEQFHKGQLPDFSEVGIKALDSKTLEITLEYPVAYFPAQLAHMSCFPVPIEAVHVHGDAWTQPGKMVSSGPYMLKSWKANDSIHLVQNPHYWDKDNLKLKEVIFRLVGDEKTEEKAFLQGQLHVTTRVPLSSIPAYRENNDPRFYNSSYWGVEFYWINQNHSALKDIRVRKAFSLALHRQNIVDHILKRGQIPTQQYVPLGGKNYRCEDPKEDVALAKALLAEAGYPDGKDFPELTFVYNTSNERLWVAQAIQEMLRKNLGVKIKLENEEWKTFLQTRVKGEFDLCRGGWVGDFPDPVTFLDMFRSGHYLNFGKWSNPAYDALLKKAERTQNQTERNALLRQAETLIIEGYPGIPLFFMNWSALVQPNVRGWHKNVLDYHPLKDVWLE